LFPRQSFVEEARLAVQSVLLREMAAVMAVDAVGLMKDVQVAVLVDTAVLVVAGPPP
jgi:hypothetical protein